MVTHGPPMSYPRVVRGVPVHCPWGSEWCREVSVRGLRIAHGVSVGCRGRVSVGCRWVAHGPSMGLQRVARGLFVDRPTVVHGSSVGCPWEAYGLLMKFAKQDLH